MNQPLKRKLFSIGTSIFYFLTIVALCVTSSVLMKKSYFSYIYVSGSSMNPTLIGGSGGEAIPPHIDTVTGNYVKGDTVHFGTVDPSVKARKNIKRYDIVTTYFPGEDYDSHGNLKQGAAYKIKRVIALPGETFKIEQGVLSVKYDDEFKVIERAHLIEDGGNHSVKDVSERTLGSETLRAKNAIVGYEVTLCGFVMSYKGTIKMAQNADKTVNPEIIAATAPNAPVNTINPVDIEIHKYGTAKEPLTIAQANALFAELDLKDGEYTAEKVYVKGTVKSHNAYSEHYGNYSKDFVIVDGEDEFLAYNMHIAEGVLSLVNEYWVMGDHRNGSKDCVTLNKPVTFDNITGVLVAIEGTAEYFVHYYCRDCGHEINDKEYLTGVIPHCDLCGGGIKSGDGDIRNRNYTYPRII